MVDGLIGLGANLGDRHATLDAASEQIAQLDGVTLLASSSWSASQAVGGPSGQDDFLNGAIRLRTDLPPQQLLSELLSIENRHGRQRGQRWAARTLDIDLLLYGDQIVSTPPLELPHPRMTFRPFVMDAAVEIAAEMRHPQLSANLAEIDERRTNGEDRVVLIGGTEQERHAVKVELATHSLKISVSADSGKPASPKLQACLDRAASPLPCTPILWLSDDNRGRWPAEIAAAVACVWPTLQG